MASEQSILKTFLIGRGEQADIRLSDDSVSRAHAELTCTDGGRYFLVDRASKFGTAVLKDGIWIPVRQSYVSLDDSIRLGSRPWRVRELLTSIGFVTEPTP